MANNNPKIADTGRRVCDRLSLSRKMVLELDNGEILIGESVDISPRGAFMQTDVPTVGDLLGITGTLFIISGDGQFSVGYPCKVARQEDNAVAIEVDKTAAAAFGSYMAKDVLGH